MGKMCDALKKSEIVFPIKYRLALGVLVVSLIGVSVLSSYLNDQNKDTGDTNVYLKEEACFADEIFISVQSLNVEKAIFDEQVDEDGDVLSKYILNLGLVVEQRHTDFWLNKHKLKPSNFKLKSVNMQARSKMEVFFECLAKETLSMAISGSIGGSVNIIEETVNFAADYTLSSIENAENSNVLFKPIKCCSDSFEPFYPNEVERETQLQLSFPMKQDYLDSESIIVLSIDGIFHFEKRIFLITRPEQYI